MDKKSDSNSKEIEHKAKPLANDGVLVIPVAFGNEADVEELLKTTSENSTLIVPDTNGSPKDIATQIMKKAVEG